MMHNDPKEIDKMVIFTAQEMFNSSGRYPGIRDISHSLTEHILPEYVRISVLSLIDKGTFEFIGDWKVKIRG